ncbi:MAG: ribosome rescue GTPase HflX [Pseudomonadota bacterium]
MGQYMRVDQDTDSLRELRELAGSAGAAVKAELVSVRRVPDSSTFLGKGKVEELADLVDRTGATLVLLDHDVSPIQERNLERAVKARVLGRSGLILDIFAQRATSREGKLQVELAQLRHLSTRLVRGWTHLERQKGGIGLRGPGETQLETDRRLIGMRIKTLKKRLAKVESQRSLRRRARKRAPIPTVSLVGYTNAGKSTLFNRITGESVLAEDRLFATLDPTMRRVELPGFGAVVLSDTVGFVRNLPHTLVAAFKSTLEEVASADCLLLVNDCSDPEADELKAQVRFVLTEIGAEDVPVMEIHNKIDRLGIKPRARQKDMGDGFSVWLSAETGDGVDLLVEQLSEFMARDQSTLDILLAPAAGALRAQLYRRCDVVAESSTDKGEVSLRVRLDAATHGWLQSQSDWVLLD